MFYKENKSESFTSGFISVLHTFGRDLKWNPPIHCLISEGAAGNRTAWLRFGHFNFTFLRFAFRTALLNIMQEKLGNSFKPTKALIYRITPDGFYVFAKPKDCEPDNVRKGYG